MTEGGSDSVKQTMYECQCETGDECSPNLERRHAHCDHVEFDCRWMSVHKITVVASTATLGQTCKQGGHEDP